MATGNNQFLANMDGKVGGMVVYPHGKQIVMRKRVFTNKSKSAPQLQARAHITGLAHLWSTLTPTQMNAWATLGAQIVHTGSGKRQSNYQAFTGVNAVLLACGQPAVPDAPAAPTPPSALPPLMLSTHYSPTQWQLAVLASAPYAGLVQVYAAAPASPGRNAFDKSAYKLIATLPALAVGGNDLTEAYTARFGFPAPGRKLALRLVPVSAAGFKGAAVEPTTLLSSASAPAAARDQGQQSALKAA